MPDVLRRLSLLAAPILLWLLAGCAGGGQQQVASISLETATAPLPTPTLLPELAAASAATLAAAPAPGRTEADFNVALPKETPTATPSPSPTPSPTPAPAERVLLGEERIAEGNYGAAAGQLEAALAARAALSPEAVAHALYNLGVAYWHDGRYQEAVATLEELLATAAAEAPPETHFYLARSRAAAGDLAGAIAAYEEYLLANPEMAAYVNPFIARAYLDLGDRAAAIAAYEAALSGPAHRLTQVDLRLRLAEFYLADQNYAAAIEQYDAVRALAVTETTRGEMTYLAGTAEIQAGNSQAGYERYLTGVMEYPRSYHSYLGLVALVEAGQPVDAFQRGLVDYYAGAYAPAVAAFNIYLEENPDNHRADTHLYLAWCYESLGDQASAGAELDAYAEEDAARATLERARMLARAGDRRGAIDTYLAYVAAYPDGSDAPLAAWEAAELTEYEGDVATAAARYREMATAYPWHEDAPEALFRSGWLMHNLGETAAAVPIWQEAMNAYPGTAYGAAAQVWLLRSLPALVAGGVSPNRTPPAESTAEGTPTESTAEAAPPADVTAEALEPEAFLAEIRRQAKSSRSVEYYALRARDMVDGVEPFSHSAPIQLPADVAADQAAAESWLRRQLGLEAGVDVASLSAELAADPRLRVGKKLWRAGLFEEAKRELEALRQEHSQNTLFSYQLALYFRDLGLYRSSIIAATSLLVQTGQTVFEAPPFIGRLAYPVYYADLILPLAEEYGYDPLLQFSLIRQESLFESFARSGAAAQGLSQVIPDTGAYIAQQLDWPDYDNEDLYKPYVGLNFGAFYLRQQLESFDGHAHAALSAYNAGPGNAARWYAVAGDDHDLYLETVNFPETRLYIERIYTGYVIYRYLYGAGQATGA